MSTHNLTNDRRRSDELKVARPRGEVALPLKDRDVDCEVASFPGRHFSFCEGGLSLELCSARSGVCSLMHSPSYVEAFMDALCNYLLPRSF